MVLEELVSCGRWALQRRRRKLKEPVNFWRGTLVVEAVIVEEAASWSWKDLADRPSLTTLAGG